MADNDNDNKNDNTAPRAYRNWFGVDRRKVGTSWDDQLNNCHRKMLQENFEKRREVIERYGTAWKAAQEANFLLPDQTPCSGES